MFEGVDVGIAEVDATWIVGAFWVTGLLCHQQVSDILEPGHGLGQHGSPQILQAAILASTPHTAACPILDSLLRWQLARPREENGTLCMFGLTPMRGMQWSR